jgi:hypothetical protein
MLPAGLRDFSPAQEVQYFRYILDEILAGHDEGQRLYADWARGKDARAADWVAKMKQLYPELYRSIVITRNQDWVPRIRSMLTQPKPTMIVVGLYHLVGPDSIQVVSSNPHTEGGFGTVAVGNDGGSATGGIALTYVRISGRMKSQRRRLSLEPQ